MTNPSDILKKRGIYEQAILAGWEENNGKHRWQYPIIDRDGKLIATRSKAYPDSTEKKYGWLPSKPKNSDAEWYILQDTKQAIQDAGGVAWLSNGEPAMLAYRAGGILNVLATTLSEIAVPKNVITYLKAMGITRLLYPVDKDAAGLRSAQNWHDSIVIQGSGIDFQAFEWPSDMPEKADANDVLIQVKGDKEAFQAILNTLTPIALETTIKPDAKTITIEFDKSALVGALYDAMRQSGKLERKIHQGIWHECHCPFHEDDKASAGFNIENGVINCMGRCGKTYSSKEVAIHFGIDWKAYYPKQEGKKKPLKRDLARFEANIEAIPITVDNRSFADIMRDEIMARLQAYEAGQYVGFGAWQKLPLSILTATLTLCNGRSNTALFLGRLHEALTCGKLPSVFNYEMLCKCLQLPYSIVFKAVFELEALSFLSKVSGINTLDSIPSIETQKNSEGRPCDWFMVELSPEELRAQIAKMLEIHFLEKHSKHALAMPTPAMARAYGLSEESAMQDYRNRIKAFLDDASNKKAKQAYDTEMFGDGTWKGWYSVLESKLAAPLEYGQYASVMDLRCALLTWWIANVRDVNSREELARLLGCSDATIDKVLDKANIISMRQQTKVEFKAPETVKAMKFLWEKHQHDLRGKCWKGGYLVKGNDGAWTPIDEQGETHYLKQFARYSGRILKVYMLIVTPSKQRRMTEEEISKRDEERAIALENAEKTAPNTAKDAITSDTSTHSPRSGKAPQFGKHSYVFLYRQLQLLFHCFTDYSLGQKQAIVFDKAGNPVHSGQLPELMTFFRTVASDTPKRKVKSFYGKGYDETIDFEALQALADSQRAIFAPEYDFEDSDILPTTREMVLEFEAPKPSRVIAEKPVYDTSKDIAELLRVFSGKG